MDNKIIKKRGRPLGSRKPKLNTVPISPPIPVPPLPQHPPQQAVSNKNNEFYDLCDVCQTTVKQNLSINKDGSIYSYSVKMCKDCTKTNVFVTL